ncbi:HNH endonuclease [Kiloniella majae]|uniref:HNH endonuclease n=1 Tax=Kiloniella majae TaxID=1938558 RepID=UPI0015C500B1|nr:HNH endonuclease signature motif containing protein [Kiloniella majae]
MSTEIFCARRLISSNLGWFLRTRNTIGEAAGRERAININRSIFDVWFPNVQKTSTAPIEITTRYLQAAPGHFFPTIIHSDQRTIRNQGGGKNWRLAGDGIKGDFYDVRKGDLLIMAYSRSLETLTWLVLKGGQSGDREVNQREIEAHQASEEIFGRDEKNMWLLTNDQVKRTLAVLSTVYSNLDDLFSPHLDSTTKNESFKENDVILNNFSFDPDGVSEGRDYIDRAVAARSGQPAFRKKLLNVYKNKCAITGTNVLGVLEAAHIIPYNGAETNNIQNGLLLRSDLHTLFDRGLIRIKSTNYSVQLSSLLKNTYYSNFNENIINLPVNESARPSRRALDYHYKHTFQP